MISLDIKYFDVEINPRYRSLSQAKATRSGGEDAMFNTMVEELARQRRADLLEQACRERLQRLASRKTRRDGSEPAAICEQNR
jgi:hypothetical protein